MLMILYSVKVHYSIYVLCSIRYSSIQYTVQFYTVRTYWSSNVHKLYDFSVEEKRGNGEKEKKGRKDRKKKTGRK